MKDNSSDNRVRHKGLCDLLEHQLHRLSTTIVQHEEFTFYFFDTVTPKKKCLVQVFNVVMQFLFYKSCINKR